MQLQTCNSKLQLNKWIRKWHHLNFVNGFFFLKYYVCNIASNSRNHWWIKYFVIGSVVLDNITDIKQVIKIHLLWKHQGWAEKELLPRVTQDSLLDYIWLQNNGVLSVPWLLCSPWLFTWNTISSILIIIILETI